MTTVQVRLAHTFKELAEHEKAGDNKAGALLKAVRDGGIKNVEAWGAAVTEAYTSCGWHAGRGRPTMAAIAAELTPVPVSIKTYVWEIRRALALGVKVGTFTTFYELRKAVGVRLQRMQSRAANDAEGFPAELEGVRFTQPDELTGAPVHDLAVVLAKLPEAERELIGRSIQRLVNKYADVAGLEERQAA